MKTRTAWTRGFAMIAVAGLLLAVMGLAVAQTKSKQQFLNVKELVRLLEIAKESGFSEQELKAITLEDNGRVINAWEFIQAQKRKAELEARKSEALRKKVYLTVQDMMDELLAMDPEDLRKLRDTLLLTN